MSHSIFAPSSMFRTVACPGWISMSDGIPDEDTQEAREGTASHWVGEGLVKGDGVAVGHTAPNGVIITDDMYDAAMVYFETIRGIAPLNEVLTEYLVPIPTIHPDCFGTTDAIWWDTKRLTLHVFDYKYGHLGVDAYENYQLIAYAVGYLDLVTGDDALGLSDITVDLHVIQPRCYDGKGAHRHWSIKAQGLRSYINIMKQACVEALKPEPKIKFGKHCRDCLARSKCPALLNAGASAIDFSTTAVHQDMSDVAIAYEKSMIDRAIDALKYRKDAIDAEILNRITEHGKLVPGYMTEQGYGNNKWDFSDKEVIALGNLCGVDLRKPDSVVTPAKAKQELKKKGVDESVINGYYSKSRTTVKLVEDDGSKAKRVFGKLD